LKAAAKAAERFFAQRFFAQRSPGINHHLEGPPLPLGHVLAEFSPCVPVRVMCGCVATACRRLATAPAGVHVICSTWDWSRSIMERVTWGRVRRVQVRLHLLIIAYCTRAALCAAIMFACSIIDSGALQQTLADLQVLLSQL
jgi:hypothetical protein